MTDFNIREFILYIPDEHRHVGHIYHCPPIGSIVCVQVLGDNGFEYNDYEVTKITFEVCYKGIERTHCVELKKKD